MTQPSFVSCDLKLIPVGEPFPVDVYIYLDFRFITYRAKGDSIDRNSYDRLEFRKVKNLFVHEEDHESFMQWAEGHVQPIQEAPATEEEKEFQKFREDLHRKALDIFQSDHPNKMVTQAFSASKKMVLEVMKQPYAVKTLNQLQMYSRGTVDHSVNVSILSAYLAMQMGYSHALILQHVAMGALLHDIGKVKVPILDGDSEEVVAKKMLDHPALGIKLLESQSKVPNEVKMIVAQHHECHDGTGFPKKLRGNAIYDLTRIVAIANVFDEMVSKDKGPLAERQRTAIAKLDQELYRKFDPQKLEKALKILKLGV